MLRTVPTPTIEVDPVEPPPPSADVASTVYLVGEHPTWAEALRTDPVVRAFLDGDTVP